MRLILIDEAQPGMILGKTIYREEDGQILLRANSVLKSHYIDKIKELKYEYIYILNPGETAANNNLQPIKEDTKIKALNAIKSTIETFKRTAELNITKIKEIILEMIDQILKSPEIVYNLNEINHHDKYTYMHSVNVSILALMTGSVMGLDHKNLELLGISALMHDIGKTSIDATLLNKPGKLEDHEYQIIKEHASKGYEILKDSFKQSYLPAHVALQHHERVDGSGYPKGLNGGKIHNFAKIVAVADVFDAITSNRVYQNAQPVYIGIQEIVQNMGHKYDQDVVNYFTRVVAPYPTGTVLTMSNGDKAIVTFVSRTKCLIKFYTGKKQGQTINLYHHPHLNVVEAIHNEHCKKTCPKFKYEKDASGKT